MPGENIDLVRSIYAAWELGEYGSADWAHPEIEYVHADGPDPGQWTGVPEMAKAFRDFLDAWEGWRAEGEEYRELDDHRVLVLFRLDARAKASGLQLGDMRTEGANVFHIAGGKVTRLVVYWNRDRALEAIGLAE